VATIDDGTEKIRVMDDQARCATGTFVFQGDLATRNGAVVAELNRATDGLCEHANEFGYTLGGVVLRELHGQRGLAGAFRAGDDDVHEIEALRGCRYRPCW
jgi:hypothetical protein